MSRKAVTTKIVLLSLLLLTSWKGIKAQTSITGTTCVSAGTQYIYTISGSWGNNTTMTWSVSGGTISGSSTGTPVPQVHVTWSGNGTISLVTSNPTGVASLNVTVIPALAAGAITQNATQSIAFNTVPATIICAAPSGGYCSPSYAYQWDSSSNNVNYGDIAGATALSLSFSSALPHTMYYKLKITETNTSTIVYSAVATVQVYPQLVSGTISPSTQTVNFDRVPTPLTVSGTSGGTGTYSYSWQSCATSNGTYTPVGITTIPSYTPSALTSTNWYEVVTSSLGPPVTSTPVEVLVNPQVIPGTITPATVAIPAGTSPGIFTVNPATGGACSGSFAYQWQSAPDNATWTNISGATGLSYSPGALSTAIDYRVRVICATDTEYTGSAVVNIGGIASDLNFVRVRNLTKPGVLDTVTADGLSSPYDVQQTTQYFDGLGRPVQTVSRQITPKGNDLVQMQVYDPFGREAIHYLPYAATTTDGNYKSTALQSLDSFNTVQYPGEQFYYGQTNFEASPLNRTLNSYPAGLSWVGNGRGVSTAYEINTAPDSVALWAIGATQGSLPTMTGFYAAGELHKNVSTDEAGHQVIEYEDKDGHVVLKKVQLDASPGTAHVGWLCTYYVYDDLDLLRFVISPLAVSTIDTDSSWTVPTVVATGLCFRYEYDSRNRMIIKKVPGAGEVHMVYDERDRLVMTQDANMRSAKQWLVTSYDAQNRPDSTGLITDPTNYNNLAYHTAAAMTTTPYPTVSGYTYAPLTQTHYDDYAWVTGLASLTATMDTSYDANGTFFIHTYTSSPYAVHQTPFYITRGMVTGTMQYLLGVRPQYTINFYDDRSRVLEVQSLNYYGNPSFDRDINQYSFSGKLLRHLLVTEKGSPNAQTSLQNDQYTYDAAFRPTTITIAYIDGYAFTVDTLRYDELGRLHAKSLGGRMDSLVYSYNIRGWMTGINKNYVAGTANDYFGMELAYDNQASVSTTTYAAAQFAGNITGLTWKSAGDGIDRKYDFTYDNLNRLTGASFLQNPTGSTWNTAAIDYSVSGLSYDANGNIQSMNQHGFKVGAPTSLIDNLTYNYTPGSNQLLGVADGANDTASTLGDFHYKVFNSVQYAYDSNGNLRFDVNKGIDSIGYNYLNLPQYIHIKGKGTITYAYDATGLKEAKITVDSTVSPVKKTTTVYVKNFQYTNDTLTQAGVPDGRARWQKQHFLNGDSAWHFFFDYFLKDHLGNTRVVLTTEKDTANYLATMEAAYRTKENALFYNVDSTSYPASSVPGGYPTDNTTVPNDSVAMVQGNPGGHTQGPALLLKVMAGDSISIGVKSYYLSGGTAGSNASSLNNVLNTLAGGLVSFGGGGGHGTLATLDNTSGSPIYGALNSFLPSYDTTPASKPKAYLNWMLVDNQFNYVSGSNQSGAIPVGNPNILNTLATTIKLKHSGYLYIWVSNETQNWMVFFDNLSVQDFSGPLLEETHYYPFGLTMAGISDKALKSNYAENKYRYNGKELQHQEFSDGSGLEEYDYGNRFFDPQLGRFFNIDPAIENYLSFSPYMYGANNPLRFVDINGLGPGDRVKKAKELEGHKYSQKEGLNTGTELRTGSSAEALEYLDCSEFVCRVLADDGITNGVQQMSTAELVDFLGDDDKFIRTDDDPQPGDVFLWRDGDEGHTGIVVSYDKSTGDVVTSEAKGEKWGSGEFTRDITDFTQHSGWKGFYRSKKEKPDKKRANGSESSQNRFRRLMQNAEEALQRSEKMIKEAAKEKQQIKEEEEEKKRKEKEKNETDNNN